jgi:spore coat polysaccharide biosynthesis protein SpsF
VTALCVVQARMGSTRLPGKVLAELAGRPLLTFMLERLRPALDPSITLVVATSDEGRDDPVADAAAQAGVPTVRGPEADVLGRFLVALDAHPAPTVVRLTADCPLADPGLVHLALARHADHGADYTSNTLVRTYPDGLDVEVVQAAALRAAADDAEAPAEREHVTPFVYRRPDRFSLLAFRHGQPLGDERWTVDTADDLAVLRDLVDRLDDPIAAPWTEVLRVAGRHAGPVAAEPWLRPLDPGDLDALAGLPRAPSIADTDQLDRPGTRWWTLELDGQPAGWLSVEVHDGAGRADGWVSPAQREPARRMLDRALAADLQVVSLTGEPTTTPEEHA